MVTPDRTVLSPNKSSGWPGGRPFAVFIHATRSGRRDFTDDQEMGATLNWFRLAHANASSHWVISAREKVRVVPDADRSWHASEHNGSAYGVEVTQPTADRPYEEGHYRNVVEVCRPYVEAGVPIVKVPLFRNGDRGFAGHEDSTQGRRVGKSDPGPEWDWPRFLSMLKGEEDEMDPREMLDAILALNVPIVPRTEGDPVRYVSVASLFHEAYYGSHRAVWTEMQIGPAIGKKQLQRPLQAGWLAWEKVQDVTTTLAELRTQLAAHNAEPHGGSMDLARIADLVRDLEQGLREMEPGKPEDG